MEATPPADRELRELLNRHESRRDRPYTDSRGNLTVGVGRNLSAVPFSQDEIELMLTNDIARARAGLNRSLPWWGSLSPLRQMVLLDMAFNLGIAGLLHFPKFLAALQVGNCALARAEMLDSLWARQVGGRAQDLAEMIDPVGEGT